MLKLTADQKKSIEPIIIRAEELLKNYIEEPFRISIVPKGNDITLQEIMIIVCRVYEVSETLIKGKSRESNIVDARHAFCFIARKSKLYSYKVIGDWLGVSGHTTILRACKKVKRLLEANDGKTMQLILLCNVALYGRHHNNYES